MTQYNHCPICETALEQQTPMGEISRLNCPNCGKYQLDRDFCEDFIQNSKLKPSELAVLSYAIRRMRDSGAEPIITVSMAQNILQSTSLPKATEQLDNLVLFLGKALTEPGQSMNLYSDILRAKIGSITTMGSKWVIEQAINLDLIQGELLVMSSRGQVLDATLSISGWQRFTELQTAASESKRAFMAMQFGDVEMDHVFLNYFKPAAKLAGYELMKLDENPQAGLIDDHLRLEIRTSRFLIADLSQANKGAYWEAGYAEGLGRPVIYTCKKSIFEHQDSNLRPHFDTNHYLIVIWDPDDLQKAADKLTDTIRVTLPTEAILQAADKLA